ncbi:MAG: winged helix-turn-helix transcriptional regulator [Nanoarchaeota archaeon]|nr:winged helix-turn-helix transcriptional regulator [Nanoarchaeota archaeon]
MSSICTYYDADTNNILDIIPHELDDETKANISLFWQQPISQKILKALSTKGSMTITTLAQELGHSVSTIHENIKKLEQKKLISTEISYEKKKQRVITSHILFATKSPRFKESLSRFFQGLWINSKDTNDIISYLQKHSEKKHTAEQISAGTNIPIHRVEIALSNWDSIITRGVSQMNKEQPFIKEVTYQAKL